MLRSLITLPHAASAWRQDKSFHRQFLDYFCSCWKTQQDQCPLLYLNGQQDGKREKAGGETGHCGDT